jgi:P-type E1-E2 ATPase
MHPCLIRACNVAQDAVDATISALRQAGIKFWMLTGDKPATAEQIAISCCLILPRMLDPPPKKRK